MKNAQLKSLFCHRYYPEALHKANQVSTESVLLAIFFHKWKLTDLHHAPTLQCPSMTSYRIVQDAVCAYRRFAGDPEQVFFGVFDGHGQHGTPCAQFAKDKVL